MKGNGISCCFIVRKSFDVNDGVLEIMYTRDTDDNSIPFNEKFTNNEIYKFDLENNITN